jgi:hypothetical protein
MKRKILYILIGAFFISFFIGFISVLNIATAFTENHLGISGLSTLGIAPIILSFFLAIVIIVYWNLTKNTYSINSSYSFKLNKKLLFTCGFVLFILDIIFSDKTISIFQHGFMFLMFLVLLIFELQKIRHYKTSFIDRFMFSFSTCILVILIYSTLMLGYFCFSIPVEQDFTLLDITSRIMVQLPKSISRFIVGIVYAIFLSLLIPLFFSRRQFNNGELILDEDEFNCV